MNFFSLIFNNLFNFLFSNKPFIVKLNKAKFLVNPRSMDFFTIAETFLDKVYEPLFDLQNVQTIVDLGAHIGDSSIWLNNRFMPKITVAVEIETDSFTMLKRNITLNHLSKKILAIHKAVYSIDNSEVSFRKLSSYSIANFLSSRFGNKKVKTVNLEKIIDLIGAKYIDYLKVDIEGAEKFILTEKNSDLFKTKIRFIAIECHSILGLSEETVKKYLENLGFEVAFKKLTLLNSHNKLIHAYNRSFMS